MKNVVKALIPPMIWDQLRRLRTRLSMLGTRAEWEYLPNGFATSLTDPRLQGWNVDSVLATQVENLTRFRANLGGTAPLGVSPEAPSDAQTDLAFHNTAMTFLYALARAAGNRKAVSMLDWGGALGQYAMLARTMLPDLELEYHCRELPLLAARGPRECTDATFWSDDRCLARTYDLVYANSSVHYTKDWQEQLTQLQRATRRWLLVTRIPIVQRVPTFAVVQRPYAFGYQTEYVGWCINRTEFLAAASLGGFRLAREVLVSDSPRILGAPEHPSYRGFLLERTGEAAS